MNASVFVANQLHKFHNTDELIKVGVNTVFLKDKNTNYDFGGRVAYENNDLIMFYGIPKRIEIDGENMIELLQYKHDALLADCYNLKHIKACTFDEFMFECEGKKYYDIENVSELLGV